MKIEVLERISYVLELPVTYWFEENAPEVSITNTIVNFVASEQPKKNTADKVIHEKIDSLTKDLNEMLKEMASK